MIRNIKQYLLMAALIVGASSCLDKYPEDAIETDQAINTVDEADQAVIGIYSTFLSSSLYSGALTLLPDLQADLVYAINGYTNIYGDAWRWEIRPNNTDVTGVYASLYAVITRANFLLDNVEKVKANTTSDEDLDRLDQYCGEAYFARALAYSELIKQFCKAYDSKEQAEQDLGVVLVTHYNTTEPIRRSSLQASYELVLSDLDKAATYLKLEEDFNETLYNVPYFNEYTVYALRARVALYMHDYEDAVKYSSKVIDSKKYVLSSSTRAYDSTMSYYQYMWAYDNSTEVIWKVGYTTSNYGGALGTIFWNYDYQSFKPDYVPAAWALNLYEEADLRFAAFFQTQVTGHSHRLSWPLLVKYWGNPSFAELGILHTNMPKPFRLSEQYLIRAEAYCNLENPNYSQAGKDISTLRQARYSTYGNTTSLGKDTWLQIIEEERVKELFMEGFRLNDLKRWHKGFTRKPQTQSIDNGSSLKIEADDVRFVWPIPQHELESPGADIEPNESNK